MNSYTYVKNNPRFFYDSLGLDTFGIGIEVPNADAISNGVLNPYTDPGHTFAYLMDNNGQITHLLSIGPSSQIGPFNKDVFQNGTLPAVSNWNLGGMVND